MNTHSLSLSIYILWPKFPSPGKVFDRCFFFASHIQIVWCKEMAPLEWVFGLPNIYIMSIEHYMLKGFCGWKQIAGNPGNYDPCIEWRRREVCGIQFLALNYIAFDGIIHAGSLCGCRGEWKIYGNGCLWVSNKTNTGYLLITSSQ